MIEFLLLVNLFLMAWHIFDHRHMVGAVEELGKRVKEIENVVEIRK